MSPENAKNGLAIEPGWTREDHGALIAQVPDIRQVARSTSPVQSADVGSLSRVLSFHLLLGLGLGLVIGVGLPSVFATASRVSAPATQPLTWFGNGGDRQGGESENPPRSRTIGLVASGPEWASEARPDTSTTASVGGDGGALWSTRPTWLSPPSSPIDTVFPLRTLSDSTAPLLAPVDTAPSAQPPIATTISPWSSIGTPFLPRTLNGTTISAPSDTGLLPQSFNSAIASPSAASDMGLLPQTLNDTPTPPQSPTAQNYHSDMRYDDDGENPFRTTEVDPSPGYDVWSGAVRLLRPLDAPGATPIHRIPEPSVGSEPTATSWRKQL